MYTRLSTYILIKNVISCLRVHALSVKRVSEEEGKDDEKNSNKKSGRYVFCSNFIIPRHNGYQRNVDIISARCRALAQF